MSEYYYDERARKIKELRAVIEKIKLKAVVKYGSRAAKWFEKKT